MATPTITPLPEAPSRQNSAGTFSILADNFMAALPQFAGQMNESIDFIGEQATSAAESASQAVSGGAAQVALAEVQARSASQSAQSAAQQASTAKTYADTAKGYRDSAQSAAAAAQASAGLPSLAGKGGLPLVAKADGTGVEYTSSLKRYDLDTATATTTLDMATAQVFQVDARTPRTLAISNAPGATRAMTAVLNITGASTITWPPGIKWDSGRLPLLGPLWTVVVLLWVGNGWVGKVGASA
ncbi:hypothetical protein [Pseudomonas plecoglossicida]|uniref:hypothetical protein n=1 Tax=Pseudomonas plecoglossicida TaxID=70775 RepID=UPI00051CE26B|nr:hypothetical protein [Pseudomonas plecoglossicida]KGK24797.1 hypothetical protein GT93_08095 [Pseudomonas plecoglossicida]